MDRHYRVGLTSPSIGEGFPGGASGKERACQCRRLERRGFSPWVAKILWRRKRQPAPVCLPGKSMDRGDWWATFHGVAKSQARPGVHTLEIQWGCIECGEICFCSPAIFSFIAFLSTYPLDYFVSNARVLSRFSSVSLRTYGP